MPHSALPLASGPLPPPPAASPSRGRARALPGRSPGAVAVARGRTGALWPARARSGSTHVGAALIPALLACLALSAVPGRLPVRSAETAAAPVLDHLGPPVAPAADAGGTRGPARFAASLLAGFDVAGALGDTVFIDGHYRTPGSPLYDACLDRLADRLGEAGFGVREGFGLRTMATGAEPTWWPEAGLLEIRAPDAPPEVLLGFASPGDAHRTMLPVGAPSAEVEGPIAFRLDDAEGAVLVTRAPLSRPTVGRAEARGALAVLSSGTFPFTVDPGGGDRHLDAIKFASAPRGTSLPVAQISRRVHERLEAAPAGAVVRLHARTRTAERPVRTLVATIEGATRPGEAVVIASHLQEPGAGDNAAGTAGLAATAAAAARAIERGEIARPARSVVFVFGDEMRQSHLWLEDTAGLTPIAALSADMLGQSPERTGAVALLERTPDPGALYTIPPDEHTPWGAGAVSADDLLPSGVNVICRAALIDVAAAVGGWRTSENPWEGGSDHDVFNRRGVPAALMWHFTDFTYHTSLDRMGMIDGEELRRTCAAITAAALDLADLGERDIARHLASNEMERDLRIAAAREADSEEAVRAWDAWCDGAAEWLRGAAAR